jgi:hypothetical protein
MRRTLTLVLVVLSLVLPVAVLGPVASAHDADRTDSPGLLVAYGRWGKVHLRMTPKQAWQTGMVPHVRNLCAGGYDLKPRFASRAYVDWNITKKPFRVHSIVVTGTNEHTTEGTHPGTTLAQLRKQHPHLSKLIGTATFNGRPHQPKRDVWLAWVTHKAGTITYQFPFGRKPTAGTRLDTLIVAKKPTEWFGC